MLRRACGRTSAFGLLGAQNPCLLHTDLCQLPATSIFSSIRFAYSTRCSPKQLAAEKKNSSTSPRPTLDQEKTLKEALAPIPSPFSVVTFAWGVSAVNAKAGGGVDIVFYEPESNSYFYTNSKGGPGAADALSKWLGSLRADVGPNARTLLLPAHPFTGSEVEGSQLLEAILDESVLIKKCAWEIVSAVARSQQLVIRNMRSPTSLEHLYLDLSGGKYASLSRPTAKVIFPKKGKKVNVKADLELPTPARLAALAWDAMSQMYSKFGSEGSPRVLSTSEHIVRANFQTVNVFVIDCDNKVQSGSVKNGVTFVSNVYNCRSKRTLKSSFRSLSDEGKHIGLSSFLFGDGGNALTMLVPSARTKAQQVKSFAVMCHPKGEVFVVEPHELSALLPIKNVGSLKAFVGKEEDPKRFWSEMCKAVDSGEEEGNQMLVRAAVELAVSKANNSISQKQAPLGAPLNEYEAFAQVTEIAQKSPILLSGNNGGPRYLNKVKTQDPAVVKALDDWNAAIYQNPDRLAREKQAAQSIAKYLVVDLETTTWRRFKRLATPFTGDNWVVLAGAKDHTGKYFMNSQYFDKDVAQNYDDPFVVKKYAQEHNKSGGGKSLSHNKSPASRSLFLPCLSDYDVIVGHNLKFDLLHLWRDNELRAFFARGGKIWDTMYGEYLLSSYQNRLGKGAGLEAVAKSYGGRIPKLDEVKQAWNDGKQTYDIPPATLKEYLKGDLDNTELIFKNHLGKMAKQRQAIITQARMDSLLCTTEMEYNGLKLDLKVASKQTNEANAKATELTKKLSLSIPSAIPPHFHKNWNWASNHHLAAYFFGGDVSFETGAMNSKSNLPGCGWARHKLSDSSRLPVYLAPPCNVSTPAECALLAGVSSSEGRIGASYLKPYQAAAGLRKSASWDDLLATEMKAVSRNGKGSKVVMKGPLAQLIPLRHLILMAAVDCDASGKIQSIHVRNPITQSSASFLVTKTSDGGFEKYLLFEVAKHTASIFDETNPANAYLQTAQVTLATRDAAFSFTNALESNKPLATLMAKYGFDASVSPGTSVIPEMSISLFDVNTALEHDRQRQITAATAKTLSKTGEPFRSDLQLSAKKWCVQYANLVREVARASAAAQTTKSVGKSTFSVRGLDTQFASSSVSHTSSSLSKSIRKEKDNSARLELLRFFGISLGTNFDPFFVVSKFPRVAEFAVEGVLSKYISDREERNAVLKKFRSPTSGMLQVGSWTLDYFIESHNDAGAQTIAELRATQKLIGTYYESAEGGTGLLSLVNPADSCVHHEFFNNGTTTGRLASANPNCQNIPKGDKSNIREMFVSRFKDGVCLEADYSQLEVVVLASLAKDREMMKDLQNKVDFHCKRVTLVRPDLSYEEVLKRAKIDKEPEFVKLRQQAKQLSFGRQYGAGAATLSASSGLSYEEARAYIKREMETYADCDFFDKMVTLSINAYDPTIQDGSRNAKGQPLYKGAFAVHTGTRYVFSETDVPAWAQRDGGSKNTNFSPTHTKNYPVQGFAGEIVQTMLGKLWRHFIKTQNYGGKAVIVNTVHDSVWIDCSRSVAPRVAKDVSDIMGDVRNTMNAMYPEMKMVLDFPVDVVFGKNMADLRPIKELQATPPPAK